MLNYEIWTLQLLFFVVELSKQPYAFDLDVRYKLDPKTVNLGLGVGS